MQIATYKPNNLVTIISIIPQITLKPAVNSRPPFLWHVLILQNIVFSRKKSKNFHPDQYYMYSVLP